MATNKKANNPLDLYANTTPKVNPSSLKQNLLERYKTVQDGISGLLANKYGNNPNINPSLGFNQPNLSPVGGWNDLQEQQGLSRYNKYLDDLYNTRNALAQYDALGQSALQGRADANVLREQAEKYLPQQLQMQGMGNVGISESSRLGIGNTYQRNVSDINRQERVGKTDMFDKYNEAMLESERNLSGEQRDTLKDYQDSIYLNSVYNLQNQTNVDDINRILKELKGKVNNEQYLDLLEKARIVARALGFTLEGKRLNPNLDRIDSLWQYGAKFGKQ